jgi:hypothetical protein
MPLVGLLAVALVWSVAHPRRVSTTPVSQQRDRLGVALYGAEFVVALALLAISLGLVIMATARNAPTGVFVATVAFIVGTGAFCVWTGTAVFYQARPGPRSLGGRSVVWAPPLVMRVATVVIVASLGTITAAMATVGLRPIALLVLGLAFLALVLIASRFLVARFVADHWGITCTNPLTTVRIPWSVVRSLEPRGSSALAQRIVVVTDQGRERMLWVVDPRVPVSRDTARLLVTQLEAVWQAAAAPRPDGID